MKRFIFSVAIVSSMLLLAFACKSTPEPTPKHQIDMENYVFVPESLDITVGDTVTWLNKGSIDHTTTSGENGVPDGNWDSGLVSPGNSFTRVFSTAGTFPYYCAIHYSMGMTGRIIVR
jgi:plastocyanin